MARIVEFAWRTPAPTSVDEELILYDDGTAWLVVRRPRTLSPTIGSFVSTPSAQERSALESFAPGPVTIDLKHVPADSPLADLLPILDQICESARQTPHAAATFYAAATPSGPGSTNLSLLVVAAGERPVEFELDPDGCAVHFSARGQPLAWLELPEIRTGFITPTAEGLGGLRSPAVIASGAHGAIAIPVNPPDGADAVSIQVAGWLSTALPDGQMTEAFEVRTGAVALTA